jgi:hypothetical protein
MLGLLFQVDFYITYLSAVPAFNSHVASDAGETSNGTLVLPSVLGDQTIGAIRTRDGGERAAGIIVASVV